MTNIYQQHFLNLNNDFEARNDLKKSKSANNSTLSLHIAAYENSVEDKTDSNGSKRDDSKSKSEKTALIKKWNTSKQGFIDSLLFIQNPFEFPRQQEDEDNYDPEVMQFKASQRLLNPNEEHLNFEENRIVPFLEQVNRLPSTDEQDILLQQSELNFDESANTFTPPQPNHLASSIHILQHPVHDAIEDLKLAMPENEDVNEKESLLAGTSFSASPTFASINMTNEFWKFHFNILSENGHDYNGKQRGFLGLVGLYNQGNSCYMNAATQALSNCPPLREYFLSYLPSVSKDRNAHIHDLLTIRRPISDAFQDLILKMWSEKKLDAIRPTFLLYKIKDRCAQFKGYTQQDAQEFIRCFLDVLHQELRYPINHIMDEKNKRDEKLLESRNSVSSSCSSSQDELNGAQGDRFETADSGLSSDTGEPSKKSKLTAGIPLSVSPEKPKAAKKREQKGQEKNQTQFRSIITDVFDGEIISTVKCMTCQHLSNTRETFQDISLSIPTLEQIAILRESSSLDFEASGEEMKKEKEEEEMEEPDGEDTQSMKHESSFALRLSHNSYAFVMGLRSC
uniref:ubiquitinyl hydrolase 1 n=1 Tax=Panagrolaimus superbus TaxID=310955 RepID=A0A914YZ66_9BILA